MTDNVRITLIEPNPVPPNLRFIRAIVLVLIFTGFGSLIDNVPMQWAGFIILILGTLSAAVIKANPKEMTIAEARKRLDELED